ncbi:DUF11 domain-containing protein [Palleronia sp. THAF1]|uniref:DUF7507 domain-containing protein n=1 Tax=Palleronia sp. THAF1 TaxID=2587842 RepID=UPI001562E3E6|nr:DUF11 domain-containing protein [Palleronia sp. THAF1]
MAKIGVALLVFASPAVATPFTTTVPNTGLTLPDGYPEAGGVAIVLIGDNGNAYYQFSNPAGAFRGFQYNGDPARFRGNPFTINDPIGLDCGFSDCSEYFGGGIAEMYIRFSAYDGDTQTGGFDENDISLRINGFNVGNWSDRTTEITNNAGTQSFGFANGFGNNTFNTGWFSSTNQALLDNILATGQTITQVFDADPNDNYWDFRRGNNLANGDIQTVAPGYELEKSTPATDFTAPGETITYEYIVTNIGSVPIRQLSVQDDKIATVTCDKTVIQDTNPGGTPDFATCTASYITTQEDVDRGFVTNVAQANGVPDFGTLGVLTDTVTVDAPVAAPAIALTKLSSLAEFGVAGTTVPYSFEVENTGNVTLTNVQVIDDLLTGFACTIPSLAPGERDTTTCAGSYTVQQSDVDAFSANGTTLDNIATATGAAARGADPSDGDALSLPGSAPVIALDVVKSVTPDTVSAALDEVLYTVTVANTGTVTWPQAPEVTDPLLPLTCPGGSVVPGTSVDCTGTYAVPQEVFDAGAFDNTATATITVDGQTATGADTATVTPQRILSASFDKRLASDGATDFAAVGVALDYEYVVTNTGSVSVAAIGVDDDRIPDADITCPAGPLAPGASATCTATYLTTQADLNAGGVTNVADTTVSAADLADIVTASDTVTVPAVQSPELAVTKTAPATTPSDFAVGNTITYDFEVVNTGNVDLTTDLTGATTLTVEDDKIGTITCGPLPLAIGATLSCTGDYVLTAQDVQAGVVFNTAIATAGNVVSDQVSASVAPAGSPDISLAKTADLATVDTLSDTITYTFTVTNIGDTQIVDTQSVTIDDALLDSAAVCNQPPTLDPGDSFDCTGTRSGVTQAEFDLGSIDNTAVAEVTLNQNGQPVTVTSNTATASIPTTPNAAFTLDKSGPVTFSAVGEAVTYSFDLENTGNVTLTAIDVSDPLLAGLSCSFTDIAPSGTRTCSGTYIVTQADFDAGVVDNTATATAIPAQGNPQTQTDTHQVTRAGGVGTFVAALDKTADVTGYEAAGDVITYTLSATNEGTLTIPEITLTDALDPAFSCDINQLAPGASDSSCTFAYTVTQADIDAGAVDNTATLTSPQAPTVTDSITLPGPARTAAFTFDKTAAATFNAASETVDFTFTVRNTGNVTLTDVTITDTFFTPALSCTIPSLVPSAADSTTCAASYVTEQADVDRGQITNTADASATPPAGVTPPTALQSTAIVQGPARFPAVDIQKTADTAQFGAPTDTITYSFQVENTGNVTLTDLVLSDPSLSFTCPLLDLEPGDVATTCADGSPLQDSRATTQDDVDSGQVLNSAGVTGESAFAGTNVSDEDTLIVRGPDQTVSLTLAKSSPDGNDFSAVGQIVTYAFEVTNSSNITLSAPIEITDPLVPNATCPGGSLAPTASVTCTGTYSVTQADLDAGKIDNSATASITQSVVPSSPNAPSEQSFSTPAASATVQADQLPALTLVKRLKAGQSSSYAETGQARVFEYVVTNSGNVTTTAPITLTDDKIPGTLTCGAAGVAPGASVTCEQTYTTDQAALDDGSVTNTAIAETQFDGASVLSNSDTATLTAVQSPMLAIDKTFVSNSNGNSFNPGDELTYQMVVTNIGNVTIDGPFTVTDAVTAVDCGTPPVTLDPGGSFTCSATYTVKQSDFDLNVVVNVASATGSFDGEAVRAPEDEAIYPIDATPALDLVKSLVAGDGFSAVGDVITYRFTYENTGNVGLSEPILVNDDRIGQQVCRAAGAPVLASGDSGFCEYDYTVTQADLDADQVVNVATVETTYTVLGDSSIVLSGPDDVTAEGADSPAFTLDKTSSSTASPIGLGDVIDYTLTLTNTGNQTLSGAAIEDPLVGALICTIGANTASANAVLAPTEALVCTGSYTVTQADVDRGVVDNAATATASDPQGDAVPQVAAQDSVTLEPAAPSLTVEKSITSPVLGDNAFSAMDQEVSFVIAVTNTGNVTLDQAVITDDLPVIPAGCTVGPIAPGATDSSCAVVYTVTQEDIDRQFTVDGMLYGGFINTATAAATFADPDATQISVSDDVFAQGPLREPALSLVKSADRTAILTPGEVVEYSYQVANIGNVTLSQTPEVSDDKIGTFSCIGFPSAGLEPQGFYSCTATYTVTQADVDAGEVTNIATLTSAEVPDDATDTLTIPVTRAPAVTIVKTADRVVAAAGETVTYTYTVTNTGNVTLTDVTVADIQTSAAGQTPLTVGGDQLVTDAGEPGTATDTAGPGVWSRLGAGDVVSFTASYLVTQADIDAQITLSNTATVTADSPAGTTPPTNTDTLTVDPVAKAPSLDIRKTALTGALGTPPAPGEFVIFEIEVENTGNQSLSGVAPTDTLSDASGASLNLTQAPVLDRGDTDGNGVLDVGETFVFTVTYALEQGAIDAGGLSNDASVTANDPQGTAIEDDLPASVIVPLGQEPALSVVKAATLDDGGDGRADVGDTIAYTYTVSNDGNVTLFDVAVTETGFAGLGTVPTATVSTGGETLGQGPALDLAVGDSMTFVATYTLVQGDIDAGGVTNQATAAASDPDGDPVEDLSGTAADNDTPTVTPIGLDPSLTVTKASSLSLGADGVATVGDQITYTFTVANDGNTTLFGVGVTETNFGGTGPIPLPGYVAGGSDENGDGAIDAVPGAVLTFQATYPLTQADIDAGGIANQATAAATDPAGDPVSDLSGDTAADNDPTQTSIPQAPVLDLVKTAALNDGGDGTADAGDTVTYTFTVENTGNVSILDLTISDTAFSGTGGVTPVYASGGADLNGTGSIDVPVGGTAVFTATYTLTQDDVDAGNLTNSAEVTATDPQGNPVTDASEDENGNPTTTLPLPAVEALSVAKTVDTTGVSSPAVAGDIITFTITVQNDGNVSLATITLDDTFTRRDGAALALAPTFDSGDADGDSELDPTETWTYSASYALTQADIDAGGVSNTVSVTGDLPGGGSVTNDAPVPAEVFVAGAPAITVDKALGATAPVPFQAVDQVIPYTFTVTNTGNVTITAPIQIDDPLIAGQGSGPVVCDASPLAVNDTLICTGSYKVTQADLDAGQIDNQATGSVDQPVVPVAPGDPTVVSASDDTDTVTAMATQSPALTIAKVLADTAPPNVDSVGDILTYDYTLTNSGNVTLDGPLTVDDDKIGTGLSCGAGPLAPNGTATCSFDYTVTQLDLNAGEVTNVASGAAAFDGAPVPTAVDATVTVDVIQSPSLSIVKELVVPIPAIFQDGEVLHYSFTVENTGNLTITDVAIADSLVTGITCNAPLTPLDPDDVVVCSAQYTIQENDISLDSVTNVASVSGLDPQGGNVTSPQDNAIFPVDAAPALTLQKAVSPADATFAKVGDTLTYVFTVINTGGAAFTEDVVVNDPMLSGPVLCRDGAASGNFLVNQSVTCEGTYSVTQDDLDAGEIVNEAVANTLFAPASPNPINVFSPAATETVAGNATPALTLAKEIVAQPAGGAAVGDAITYRITATNTGNQTIGGVTISDPLLPSLSCTVGGQPAPANVSLAPAVGPAAGPGQALICEGSYTLTQADLDSQELVNTATASGADPAGTPVAIDPASATADLVDPAPLLVIQKDIVPAPAPGAPAFTAVGDLVQFRVTAQNAGNVTLDAISITDALPVSPAACQIATLAPAAQDASCLFSYTVTQADIDARNGTSPVTGGFTNDASATAQPRVPGSEPVTAEDDVFVPGPLRQPALSMTKTAQTQTVASAGTVVRYTYVLTNSGNVTLTDQPSVIDDKIANVDCAPIPAAGLPPSQTLTCTADYTITQDDIEAGGVTNIARAQSDEVLLPATPGPETATETVTATQTQGVTVAKTADATQDVVAGQTITYSYIVTNTGNLRINAITLDDRHTSASGTQTLDVGQEFLETDTAPAGDSTDAVVDGTWDVLAPGDAVLFTSTYTVTQADIDAEAPLTNTVILSATDGTGAPVTATDDESVQPAAPTPALTVLKTADTSALSDPVTAGEPVVFTITVENSGNQTLGAPSVTDTLRLADGTIVPLNQSPIFVGGDAGADSVFSVGELWTYRLTYILDQAAIDAGGLLNSATATALDPDGVPVSDTSDDGDPTDGDATPTPVILPSVPSIVGEKLLTPAAGTVGETLQFMIAATNDGNVTLTGVAVASDTLTRADGTLLALASGPTFLGADQGSGAGSLLPGETASYRATYVLTQADLDAGGVSNTATVTGTPPIGGPLTDVTDDGDDTDGNAVDDPTELVIPATPALTLVKQPGATAPGTFTAVDQIIPYDFIVTNTGNVTVTDQVNIVDPLIAAQGGAVTCPVLPDGLAPGAATTCTGSVAVTQADIDAGQIDNIATATAGDVVADQPGTATVLADQMPSLEIQKTAQTVAAQDFVVRASITYDYVLTNTGNVTLTDEPVLDDNLIPAADLTCDAFPADGIAPGATFACTGLYTVTATDVDLGSVTNVVSATSGDVDAPPVTETIPEGGVPLLDLTKTPATGASYAAVGDTIDYSFTVTNAGTRAFVRPVTVFDDRLGDVICFTPTTADPDFQPGESVTCTATDIVTQADLDAGTVVNSAFAETEFGADDTSIVSNVADAVVPAVAAPSIALEKSVTPLPVTQVGQVLTYTLSATNTGNQTLSGVLVTDDLLSAFSCSAPQLLPEATLNCSGTYTVTQADVDAGTVVNTAGVAAFAPNGDAVTGTASVTVDMPAPAPVLVLEKIATPSPFGAVGTSLTYILSLTNDGNVTLSNLSVTDPLAPAGFGCAIPALAPGQTDQSCTFALTVTQDLVDAGEITNTASATATTPGGVAVGADDTLVTPGPTQAPALEVTKIATSIGAAAGQVTTYQIFVENTGNVSLTNIIPVDQMQNLDGDTIALDAGLTFVSGDNGDGVLDVAEVWIYEGQRTLTQADVNAGGLINSVTATGQTPGGGTVQDVSDDGDDGDGNATSDPTIAAIPNAPALTVVKAITTPAVAVGETVVFTVTAENTGNTDLGSATIDDSMSRLDGTNLVPTVTPVSVPDLLSPGDSAVWQVSYVLTQADIDAGGVQNSAVVQAPNLGADGGTVSDLSADDDPLDGDTTGDPTVLTIGTAPALEVIKTATTVGAAAGEDVVWQVSVQNTGNVTLTSVVLADTLTDLDGVAQPAPTPVFVSADAGSGQGTLQPGETAIYSVTATLTQDVVDSGGYINVATATATTPGGATLSDLSDDDGTNPSDPTVTPVVALPSLAVVKTAGQTVSLFPTVQQTPFTITVENTGNVTQTELSVTDDLAAFAAPGTLLAAEYPPVVTVSGFGTGANPGFDGASDTQLLAPGSTLAPGETATITIVATYTYVPGSGALSNAVSVNAQELVGTEEDATGVNRPDADGDGVPDDLEGNGDRDGDGIPDDQDYDPTGYFYCEDDGRLLTGGQIAVTGNGFTQTGVGTSGPITVVADGSLGNHQFFTTQPGTYQLVLTYPPAGPASAVRTSLGTLDATTLLPANPASLGSNEQGNTGVLADFTAPANPFYTAFTVEAGDPFILNNNIPVQSCGAVADVVATKVVDRETARLGETVNYTLTFRNDTLNTYTGAIITDVLPAGFLYTPGSGVVNGVAQEPAVNGRVLNWTVDLAPSQTITVTLAARISAQGGYGTFTNETFISNATGRRLSNVATADVRVDPDAVFACSDVIGKVFDDKNRNGYQDGPGTIAEPIYHDDYIAEGKGRLSRPVERPDVTEPGIPGVRLVAPDGTLITTDSAGRYSVPCATLPRDIGSNFMLKLDDRTLPTGYRVTTENPRVVRLTPGKMARLNFGAALGRVVDIDLTAQAFQPGQAAPLAGLRQAVDGLIAQIADTPSVLRLTYQRADAEAPPLARARLAEVEALIRSKWRGRGNYTLDIEKTVTRGR